MKYPQDFDGKHAVAGEAVFKDRSKPMTISKEAVGAVAKEFRKNRRYRLGAESEDEADVRAMQAAITALLQTWEVVVNKWQPIETAPKNGVFLVIFNGTVDIARNAEKSDHAKRWFWLSCNGSVPIYEITHWQPLPSPPAQKEGV